MGGRRRRGGVAELLPEHTVVPQPWSTPSSPPGSVWEPPAAGRTPAVSHIIGRPNDDLLDVMLGPGADPEQAIIGASGQDPEEDEGIEDRLPGDRPTVSEL